MSWYKKHTKRRLDDNYSYKPKRQILSGFFGFVFYSVLSSIIFLLVYSFFFAPELTTNAWEITKEKISDFGDKISFSSTQNSVTGEVGSKNIPTSESICKSEYKEYSKIGEQKYGIDINFIKIQKINNSDELNKFYELYGSNNFWLSLMDTKEEISVFPIYVIANSVKHSSGFEEIIVPLIVTCNPNGHLTDISIKELVG